MQQGGHPQDEVGAAGLQRDGPLEDLQGVVVDVLVLVMLVDLQPQGGQLGQDVRRQPRVDQQLEPDPRMRAAQQLVELVGDPLDRDDLEPVRLHRDEGSTRTAIGVVRSPRRTPRYEHHVYQSVGA